jgi:acyl-CoA thioesterase YciA
MTDVPYRDPVLRTVARRTEINSNGHIFGGWLLSQMDIAGGITAGQRAQGPVATVAINAMEFVEPMLIGDILSIYTEIKRIGRTSIAIQIDALVRRRGSSEERLVTRGLFTFVAIGSDGRPRLVDPPAETLLA